MTVKRLSLRFNLDRENDRKAWETLQRMEPGTVNKEIIARINGKDQIEVLRDFIRQVVSEELPKAVQGRPDPQTVQEEYSEEEMNILFNFLDSF